MPTLGNEVHTLQLVIHTSPDTYSDCDDENDFCVSANDCYPAFTTDWDDYQLDAYDVVTVEGLALDGGSLDRLTVKTRSGGDQWKPQGFSLTFDGLPVYCADNLTVKIGSDSGESKSYTDSLGMKCDTLWPTPLTVGPMLGAVDADGARIWYRTDYTRPVLLRVASTESALASAPIVHYGYPSVENDFTEAVHVQGLSPESTWYYDLEIAGVRYGPWSFKTAPDPHAASRFRFAFGSCAYVSDEPVFGALALYHPDVFLFLGDNHYGDTPDTGAQRQYYREAHTLPLRRDFLHESSILMTWDDHDYAGNDLGGTASGKEDALRVFKEYSANSSAGIADTPGVFTTQRYGPVEFFLIDDRYYRGLDDSILGDAQEAWLLSALQQSDATFKILASGSQWTIQGTSDSWAEYPDAQKRMIAALATIPGVVFLSGDVHHAELRLLPGVGYDIPELTASPLARNSSSGCPGDSEIIACYAYDNFIGVEVDTTLPDPTLNVHIFSETGEEQAQWLIHRSELE